MTTEGSPRLDPSDAALVAALTGPVPGEEGGPDQLLTLAELADDADLSFPLLEAIAREGFLIPRVAGPPAQYSRSDGEIVRSGLELVEAGLPLAELLDLARRYDAAMEGVADHAVDLFVRFVRDPVQGTAASSEDASQQLVGAFQKMLPATSTIVAHHFRRMLLARAQVRLTEELAGDPPGAGSGQGRS